MPSRPTKECMKTCTPRHTQEAATAGTCPTCFHWRRLGEWWGRCSNNARTAIETEDPGAGPEMTRKTFRCTEHRDVS